MRLVTIMNNSCINFISENRIPANNEKLKYENIIIIGASGLIGRHLFKYCQLRGLKTYGTFYSNNNSQFMHFDLLKDSLIYLCEKLGIDNFSGTAIVICSALSSIDGCKKNVEFSTALNVNSTKKLIEMAESLGIKVVFLSTEAVFDGNKGYYSEQDFPNPVTLYGRQKLEIENYLTDNYNTSLILRISRTASGILGESDIFNEFYNKMKSNQTISCIKGQSFCLTDVEDICEGIFKAVNYGLSGIYHLSSENYVTRYELGLKYAGRFFPEYNLLEERELNTFSFVDGRHIKGGLNGKKLASMLKIRYKTLDEILENCSI